MNCKLFILSAVVFSHINIPQFINPTVNGHLCTSQAGAVTNNTAMNILSHFFWRTFYKFLWGRKQELGHRVQTYSALVDTTKQFSKVVVPTNASICSVAPYPCQHFFFFLILPTLVVASWH